MTNGQRELFLSQITTGFSGDLKKRKEMRLQKFRCHGNPLEKYLSRAGSSRAIFLRSFRKLKIPLENNCFRQDLSNEYRPAPSENSYLMKSDALQQVNERMDQMNIPLPSAIEQERLDFVNP